MTIVVGAAQMDRCRKPRQTNLAPTGIGDIERLEAAAHVVAVNLSLAGQFLRLANCFGDQRRIENGAVVEILPTLSFDVTWLLPLSTTYLRMSWIAG